jgi:hypothetical protein
VCACVCMHVMCMRGSVQCVCACVYARVYPLGSASPLLVVDTHSPFQYKTEDTQYEWP